MAVLTFERSSGNCCNLMGKIIRKALFHQKIKSSFIHLNLGMSIPESESHISDPESRIIKLQSKQNEQIAVTL